MCERLDLAALEEAVRRASTGPARRRSSPRLAVGAVAVWGERRGGQRAGAARLCESHDAYRWLCGGVSVNYHGLSDFRVAQGELLDRLLSRARGGAVGGWGDRSRRGGAGRDAGARGGGCVPRSAAGRSFTRSSRRPRRLVKRLQRGERGRPGGERAGAWRRRSERAAREREARVEAALAKLGEIEAERQRRGQAPTRRRSKEQSEPRASDHRR